MGAGTAQWFALFFGDPQSRAHQQAVLICGADPLVLSRPLVGFQFLITLFRSQRQSQPGAVARIIQFVKRGARLGNRKEQVTSNSL